MKNSYCVYIHKNLVNEKRYIGMSSNPTSRFSGLYNSHLQGAIKKYGQENFETIIVADNLTRDNAHSLERALIVDFKTLDERFGYNKTIGSYGRPKKHIKKSKGISLKVYDELYNQVMTKIETEQQQGIEVSLTGILTKALNDYVKE